MATYEKDFLMQLYRTMVRIRAFEEKAAECFTKGMLAGNIHLSIGQEAAEAGASVEEILAMLAEKIPQVEMSFVLDRLDYMKKGGRCSAVLALGANLLKLHPCIEVSDGSMGVVKKSRGSMEKVVADYLRDRLEGRTDLDESRAILVDTCEDDHLAAIAREILQGRFDEVLEAKAGCTIFSHCGPRTLGVLLLRK